jgi:lipid-A-disaccharide synthase-like uncharacterized protein
MKAWIVIGFAGQIAFFLRFFVQWISSERKGESHIPMVFWYFSLAGGALLLAYSIERKDPVFIAGQAFGFIVYIRNIVLIRRRESARSPA